VAMDERRHLGSFYSHQPKAPYPRSHKPPP
jgi:hypothetical protein